MPEIPISDQGEIVIRLEDVEQIQKKRMEEIKQEAKQAREKIAYNAGVHRDNTLPHQDNQTRKPTRIYPLRPLPKLQSF